jgi:hypothetical protein
MKFELVIFSVTAFFLANTYHDGKYLQMLKSWKKYYQMATIAFVGLSAYVFIRKYPTHSRSLFKHANGLIKYMPIDKEAGDFLTPFLDMTGCINSGGGGGGDGGGGPFSRAEAAGQHRMMNSGKEDNLRAGGTKRCVSETKKKFVAAQQGWKCGDCQRQLPAWFEVDHRVRLDNGGSNHVDNLVAMCRDCHGKKTAMENL